MFLLSPANPSLQCTQLPILLTPPPPSTKVMPSVSCTQPGALLISLSEEVFALHVVCLLYYLHSKSFPTSNHMRVVGRNWAGGGGGLAREIGLRLGIL